MTPILCPLSVTKRRRKKKQELNAQQFSLNMAWEAETSIWGCLTPHRNLWRQDSQLENGHWESPPLFNFIQCRRRLLMIAFKNLFKKVEWFLTALCSNREVTMERNDVDEEGDDWVRIGNVVVGEWRNQGEVGQGSLQHIYQHLWNFHELPFIAMTWTYIISCLQASPPFTSTVFGKLSKSSCLKKASY